MISIWMITYNHALYVRKAIEGVLAQQHGEQWELIIGDDCSSDDTLKIVLGFQQMFPSNIKVLSSSKNIGVFHNVKRTFDACSGEYIAMCEGDDFWTDPLKLKKQFDLMQLHPTASICFHNMNVIYDQGNKPTHNSNQNQKPVTYINELCVENYIYTASAFIRRSAIPDFPNWFASAMPLDYPLFVLAARNGEIRYIDDVMGVYRVHAKGMWNPESRKRHFYKVYRTLKNLDKQLEYKYTDIFRKRIVRHEFDLLQQLLEKHRYKLARHYYLLLLKKYITSAPRLYRYLITYGVRSHLQLAK